MAVSMPKIENQVAFEFRNVGFGYAMDEICLENIDLSVPAGKCLALLGANGCGKSTILKLMNGLIFPTSGEIECYGIAVTESNLKNSNENMRFRKRVGFVFQNSDAQLFNQTVLDEIAFGPLQLNLPIDEIQNRIADVCQMLKISHLLDRSPFRLSGGEKKKVAIASVLVTNPDVILLDEPTNGLDPRSQVWLRELLLSLKNVGKTIVIATHDLELALDTADNGVALSEDHRVAKTGPIDTVLADRELLCNINLIHEHSHWHGNLEHAHQHSHVGEHEHSH